MPEADGGAGGGPAEGPANLERREANSVASVAHTGRAVPFVKCFS